MSKLQITHPDVVAAEDPEERRPGGFYFVQNFSSLMTLQACKLSY